MVRNASVEEITRIKEEFAQEKEKMLKDVDQERALRWVRKNAR